MRSYLVKTRIPEDDYQFLYDQAKGVRLTVDDVLGKAIAIGLYAMRRYDARKSLFIHTGKSFKRLDLDDINLSEEESSVDSSHRS